MKQNRSLELIIVVVLVAVTLSVAVKHSSTPTGERTPVRGTPTPTPTTPSTPQKPLLPSPRATAEPVSSELVPLEGKETPELTEEHRVRFITTAGDFVVRVYPQAAPNAAQRFLELVDIGFYNNTAVSRVVPGFVAQFGVNPNMPTWKERTFDDDPALFQHLPGTIAFAKAGPNTNSTQVFINYVNNNRLADPGLNFTVFGLIEGMETVEKFQPVGDSSGGLDQQRLWSDPSYLDSLTEKPTMIISAHTLNQAISQPRR